MSPPIPYVEEVPGSPLIFLSLNLFAFLLHIIAMNLLLGLTLISCLDTTTKGILEKTNVPKALPVIFALTINLGVAPLLFLQVLYGHLFYVSSILMAKLWITTIPILIASYYGTYIVTRSAQLYLNRFILLGICIFLLWVAFLFANNMTMMIQPQNFLKYFHEPGGTVLNESDMMLWPRIAHMIVGGLAVSYLFLAMLMEYKYKKKNFTLLRRFVYITFLQMLIGIWFFFSIKKEALLVFLRNPYYIIVLSDGIIFGILSALFAKKDRLMYSIFFLFLTLISMVITRHNLRAVYLRPYFGLDQLSVSPQYLNLILFLAVFVLGLLVVAWLLRLAFVKQRG